MQFCSHCGSAVPDDAAFCQHCAASMQGAAPVDAGGRPGFEPPYYAPGDASTSQQAQGAVLQPGTPLNGPTPAAANRMPLPSAQRKPARPGARTWDKKQSFVYSAAMVLAGWAIIYATFLPWLTYGITGWQLTTGGGNFMFRAGNGIFFSGFWSLLAGIAMIAGAALFHMLRKVGARVVQLAASVGALLMIVNIVMCFSHSTTPGVGVWIFLVLAVAAAVASEYAIRTELEPEDDWAKPVRPAKRPPTSATRRAS